MGATDDTATATDDTLVRRALALAAWLERHQLTVAEIVSASIWGCYDTPRVQVEAAAFERLTAGVQRRELWPANDDGKVHTEAVVDGAVVIARMPVQPWRVVTETMGREPSRVECGSDEEAARIYGATLDSWVGDDRFVSAHIEGPDGRRYLPTETRREFGSREYGLPLLPEAL